MQIVRFALVGIVGFVTDVIVLLALTGALGVPPLPARVGSFVCAATLTYSLNRRFTFAYGPHTTGLWSRYLLTTSIGAVINVGAFNTLIVLAGAGSMQLVLGTAIGSILAMFFNYGASRAFVFRKLL